MAAAGWMCRAAERGKKDTEMQAGQESRQSSFGRRAGAGLANAAGRLQKPAAAIWMVFVLMFQK